MHLRGPDGIPLSPAPVHFGNHDRDRALRHVAAGDVGVLDRRRGRCRCPSRSQLGPGSRDTLGLLEGDEGSPFRRMDPAEGAELSLLGWT